MPHPLYITLKKSTDLDFYKSKLVLVLSFTANIDTLDGNEPKVPEFSIFVPLFSVYKMLSGNTHNFQIVPFSFKKGQNLSKLDLVVPYRALDHYCTDSKRKSP